MILYTINKNILTRAIAISLIVINHGVWVGLPGGVNFLLLLSGYNLARFSFNKSNQSIATDMLSLAWKIVFPSLLILLVYSLYKQEFYWPELSMLSNLFYPNKIPLFPVWYPQALLQMMFFLAFIFLVFKPAKYFQQYPLASSAAALFIAFALYFIANIYWDEARLFNRNPIMLLWNFIFGWVIWAIQSKKINMGFFVVTLLTIITAYFMFVVLPYNPSWSRVLIFTCLTLLFLSEKDISLPNPFYQLITLVANATFYIFLFHLTAFQLFEYFVESNVFDHKLWSMMKIIVSIILSVMLWLIATSARNAYQNTCRAIAADNV